MSEKEVYKSFSTINPNRTKNGQLFNLDVIKQDIFNLAKMRKGEMPMDVNRGFLINDYLFHPELSEFEKNEILDDAREQLDEDPRITFVDGQVLTLHQRQGLALIITVNVMPFDEDIQMTIEYDI